MISKQVAVTSMILLAFDVGTVTLASADEAPEAQELFNQGQAKYAEKEYSAALASLEASLKLEQAPETLLLIAHCHRMLGYDQRALKQYLLYQAEWARLNPDTPSPHAGEVERQLAALREKISQRKAKLKRVTAEKEQRRRAAAKQRQRRQAEQRARAAKQRVRGDRRRRVLRIVTISGAALTASAAFAGGVFHVAANRAQDANSARNVSITGFVLAGVFGAAAATSGVLYLLSRRRDRPSAPTAAAAVSPTVGGAAVTAVFRF